MEYNGGLPPSLAPVQNRQLHLITIPFRVSPSSLEKERSKVRFDFAGNITHNSSLSNERTLCIAAFQFNMASGGEGIEGTCMWWRMHKLESME